MSPLSLSLLVSAFASMSFGFRVQGAGFRVFVSMLPSVAICLRVHFCMPFSRLMVRSLVLGSCGSNSPLVSWVCQMARVILD